MTSQGNEGIRTKVFRRVRLCMENLAGGSGHLGCYHLSEGTFRIEGTRDLGDGLTEYVFSVTGWLEDEFTVAEPPDVGITPDHTPDDPGVQIVSDPRSENTLGGPDLFVPSLPSLDSCDHGTPLRGSLVLDSRFRIVLDAQGRVRLQPWKTIDPEFWMQDE